MARKIVGAVRLADGTVLKEGDEAKLSALDEKQLSKEDLKRLQDEGVIKGFVSGKAKAAAEGDEEDEEEATELPKIRDLREHLSNMDDVDEIEAMMESDDRESSVEIYEARIRAIKAEQEADEAGA
jgi:hypothetical protein